MLSILKQCNAFLWNGPLIILLLAIHIYFTLRLRFIQKHLAKGIGYSLSGDSEDKSDHGGHHRLSGFATLSTTLAATLGTGNIIGVSSAIYFGGPGAVFWCFLSGVLGMATAYAESYLSLRYRPANAPSCTGGPMYVLKYGLRAPKLAIFYAVCLVISSFGIGVATQVQAAASHVGKLFHLPYGIFGILCALMVGLVIRGGIRSVGSFCAKLVPFLGFVYIGGCLYLLIRFHSTIPEALALIFRDAFTMKSAAAGLLGGQSLLFAVRYGLSRGLFSNEIGLGSTGIASCASCEEKPAVQSLISMTAPFWDTVVLCAVTGIVIVVCMMQSPALFSNINATELTNVSFGYIPWLGKALLAFCLLGFAITSMIGWYTFGEQGVLFLTKSPAGKNLYQWLYLVMVFFGSILSLEIIWESADFFNALLIFPNILSLFLLRKQVTPPDT